MKSLTFACLCASTLVQEATPEPLRVHPTWGIQKIKNGEKYGKTNERKQR